MKSRALLIVALLASPAWSQEPATEAAAPAAKPLDLRSDAVKKIVHDAAASQYASVVVTEAPIKTVPREFVYVPPEKPPAPVAEAKIHLPDPEPTPKSNGFLASTFEFLLDQALGNDEFDDTSASNAILSCRIQKEQKTSPPGVDHCPAAE